MTVPEGQPGEERSSNLRNAMEFDSLVEANNESNRTMLALVNTVRAETAARDRKVDALDRNIRQMRLVIVMVAATIVVLLTIGVFNAINLNQTRESQHQVEALNQTVLDCVNGTGDCGRINAQNQDRVLNEVKKYNLIGFYCIRNNPATDDPQGADFLQCMARLYPGGPTLPSNR